MLFFLSGVNPDIVLLVVGFAVLCRFLDNLYLFSLEFLYLIFTSKR